MGSHENAKKYTRGGEEYLMDFEWHFRHHVGRRIDKWQHYFDIYDRHFERFRGKRLRVLEIGVDHGGSLQLWKKYFGADAKIVGLDINAHCADYAEDRIEVRIGNQANVELLKSLGIFDIVIDDGSHRLQDQLASFEALWPNTRSVYLIEDCHQQLPTLPNAPLTYVYPWVVVAEKPRRMIRGDASRELRPDEAEASKKHQCP
jgi:cephalosporin hydroxylase